MKRNSIVGFVLIWLVAGACSSSGDGMRKPTADSLDELLGWTDGFTVIRFENFRRTTLGDLGGDPNIEDNCYLAADVVVVSDVVRAWSYDGQGSTMMSFCERCFGDETSTCGMPEWHYLIPDEAQQEFAVFFTRSYNPEMPDGLDALFVIEDGEVDMTPIPGGERVALEDMESYLQALNTDSENKVFLP